MSQSKRIHGGLILVGGVLGLTLAVLVLGASRGQSTNAGLPGSTAADFALPAGDGQIHRVGQYRGRTLVLIAARRDAENFDRAAGEINQIYDTFAKDAAVSVLGVQIATDTGLLSESNRLPGMLESRCPGLTILRDDAGVVARGYRTDRPTAFVIDPTGVIRARVPLDRDGAAVAVMGTVSGLRSGDTGLPGVRVTN